MVFEDECTLSLGNCSGIKKDKSFKIGGQSRRSSSARSNHLFPSKDLQTDLSLRLLMNHSITPVRERATMEEPVLLTRSPSPSIPSSMVKREREFFSEELETERLSSRVSDEEEEGSGRKKLRLTKEQSSILEQSFKQHSTLNPKQKQSLAKELNLRPRQVEVWFQNRRARTKLKQTEVDCEFLRKCCETLTDDNQRLQKELQELKALKFASTALYMQQQQQLPAATSLTMCPSCETLIATKDNSKKSTTNRHFTMTSSNTPFYKLFSHPSAAC